MSTNIWKSVHISYKPIIQARLMVAFGDKNLIKWNIHLQVKETADIIIHLRISFRDSSSVGCTSGCFLVPFNGRFHTVDKSTTTSSVKTLKDSPRKSFSMNAWLNEGKRADGISIYFALSF